MTPHPKPAARIKAAREIATALQVDPKQPGTVRLALALRDDRVASKRNPARPATES